MRRGITAVVFVLSTAAGLAADETPTLQAARVRIRAAGHEIPGILAIGRHEVTTKGVVVADDHKLVAVKVVEWPEPVCLPRPDETLTGRVTGMDAHGLIIVVDGHKSAFRIPRDAIRSLDVSTGHANRGGRVAKGAGLGFVVGAGLGAILGAATADDCSRGCFFDRTETAVFAGTGLGVLGLAIGALRGAGTSTELWKPVTATQWTVRLHPVRGGGGVTIAFAFR